MKEGKVAPYDAAGECQSQTSGLALENVVHAYGDHVAVRDVSFSIAPGELLCLLGPSGCGKTTTLRIAAGLEHPARGRVLLNGEVVAGEGRTLPPEHRQVGFLFQDFALFPHLSVLDNVTFGLGKHVSAAEKKDRAMAMLAQVGMADYATTFPHMLSGGQQQRVALARALAPKPRLMLLDEPFSGLDSRLRDQIRDETLHVLKANNVATLMVTHDPEEAMFMADRIALMRDGRIVQMGSPEALFFHPADGFVVSFFGEVNVLQGTSRNGQVITPLGTLPAPNMVDGAAVEVLIRPEGMTLSAIVGDAEPSHGAQVIASRLLGRTSLIHLCVGDRNGEHLHLHARMPGRFLPQEREILDVRLDRTQAFVFPKEP